MKNYLTKDEGRQQNASTKHFIFRRLLPVWALGYALILIFTWLPAPICLVDGMTWLQTHMSSFRMAANVAARHGESVISNQIMQLYGMLMSIGFTVYFLTVGLPELSNESNLWLKNLRMETHIRPWKTLGAA